MTAKPDSFMPLYIGDYLKDTGRLSTIAHGAYFLLLMDGWINGPAPDDDRVLASITKTSTQEWKRLRPSLTGFFQIEDGQWRQRRLERERAKAIEMVEKKRAAGQAGGIAARGKSGRKSNSGEIADEMADGIAELIAGELQKNTPSPSPTPLHSPDGEKKEDTSLRSVPPKPPTRSEPNALEEPEIPGFLLRTQGSLVNGQGPSATPRCSAKPDRADLNRAYDAYNAAASRTGWIACQKRTTKRNGHLCRRLQDAGGIEGWLIALEKAEASDWFCGKTPPREGQQPFRADIDFLLRESSFVKLMEGKYDNRAGSAKRAGSSTTHNAARAAAARFDS